MGMQHDFNFDFEIKPDITAQHIVAEIENRKILGDLDRDSFTIVIEGTKAVITFSFYSSYCFLNEVDEAMRLLIRNAAKPGTEANFYYEEFVTDHESIAVPA